MEVCRTGRYLYFNRLLDGIFNLIFGFGEFLIDESEMRKEELGNF